MSTSDLQFFKIDTKLDGLEETQVIAFSKDEIVGTAKVCCSGRRSASVCSLFVSPKRVGTGVGKAILKYCEDLSLISGCETLAVLVDKNNLEVEPFYASAGFTFCYQYDDKDILLFKKL